MSDLFALVPPIRRARGYRLYDQRGRRLLDLWQAGGAAVLGHRPGGVVLAMKGEMEHGLLAALPGRWEGRLAAALRLLFSGPALRPGSWRSGPVSCAWYASRESRAAALKALDLRAVDECRPFMERAWEKAPPEALLPVLPCPASFAPEVAVFAPGRLSVPPRCDPVSPIALAGLTRAVHDLVAVLAAPPPAWDSWRTAGFERNGPYLRPLFSARRYEDVFRRFLDAGVLLSPDFSTPSVLPGEWSAGERSLVEGLCDSIG